MPFDLKYKVDLAPRSQELFDSFVTQNKDKKEVTSHDVFELLAKGTILMLQCRLSTNKKLSEDEQKQLLRILFDILVKDENNDFKEEAKIDDIINLVYDIKNNRIKIDLGQDGMGCLPCRNVKVEVNK